MALVCGRYDGYLIDMKYAVDNNLSCFCGNGRRQDFLLAKNLEAARK